MSVSIKLVNKCLWCDEVEIPFDKMLCSNKCLNELKDAIEEQHGKGHYGYDMSDVYKGRKK